jgi:3-deoxy-manno-octulosonate cytidylyltransferase (CMP-KDO synthetase)
MRVLGVVPARLGSTRLPNKPLQLLAGEPLITRVAERALEHGVLDQLVVATDSAEVGRAVDRLGIRTILTGEHRSGTDRVAEVARRQEFRAFDAVVNIQGDEPFLSREALIGALTRVQDGDEIGTAAAPLDESVAAEPSRVKVVTDSRGRALYFSRAVIPYSGQHGRRNDGCSCWQHVGLYAFTPTALERLTSLPEAPLEQAEHLEQLRALYYGMVVGVALLEHPAFPGIDTAEDLRRAEAHWQAYQGQV